MTEAEKEKIERACARLVVDYARHTDFGNYDAFADLFTEDGVLAIRKPLVGREAIRHDLKTYRSPKLRSRHVMTNIHIEVIDADHAEGVAYLSLYRFVCEGDPPDRSLPLNGPFGIGQYVDKFVRTADGWRIQDRRLTFAFQREAEPA